MNWTIVILAIIFNKITDYLLDFNYSIVSDPFDLTLLVLDIGQFVIIYTAITYIIRYLVPSPSKEITDC